MKIIIVGAGKVGAELCLDLVSEGHDIVLIEKKAALLNELISKVDITGLVGDGADINNLIEAGVGDCDIFISVTSSDETNMLSCVMAGKLGAKLTIARVTNHIYQTHSEFMKDSLGISMIVNPDNSAALNIINDIEYNEALNVESIFYNKVDFIELQISENSMLVDQQLNNFRHKYKDVLVACIKRGKEVIIPRGSHTIKLNDRVLFAGSRLAIHKFLSQVSKNNKPIKNIIIIGGGKITTFLVNKLLEIKANIKIVEVNENVARHLSDLFPKVEVLMGDGTDSNFLTNIGIDNADALIALTGIDEENIMISMLAKKHNVKKIITKVNRKELLNIVDDSQLQSIITPKSIIADNIVSVVRALENSLGSNVEQMYRLMNNSVEVLTFNVKPNSKIINKPIKDLNIQKNCLIVYIIRNNGIIAPSGNDVITTNDRVIVITSDTLLNDLDEILL